MNKDGTEEAVDTSKAPAEISHEDLTAAAEKEVVAEKAEGNGEEAAVSAPEPDPDPEVEPTHGEKSWFGRKLKPLKDENTALKEQLSEMNTKLANLTGQISVLTQGETETKDPDEVATVGDVQRLLEHFVSQQNETRETENKKIAEYETKYLARLDEVADEVSAEDFVEIKKLIAEPAGEFNKVRTGDPELDFEFNYNKALLKLRTPTVPKKPNLKGDKPKGAAPAGEGKSDTRETERKTFKDLSPEAQALVKGMKESDPEFDESKFVEEAFKSDMSPGMERM